MDPTNGNQGLTADDVLAALQPASHMNPMSGPVPAQAPDPLATSVPKDRFDEVMAQLREANARIDTLMMSGLVNRPGNQESPPQFDQEVLSQVKPILDYELERQRRALLGDLAPIINFVKRQDGLQQVASHFPGAEEVQAEAIRLYQSLSPQEKARYDRDDPIVMEALMGRVMHERMRQSYQPTGGSTDPMRAHSVPRGTATPQQGRSPQEMADAIRRMPSGDWAAFSDQLRQRLEQSR